MNIIDLHCDALSKLLVYPQETFIASKLIDVTLEQLIAAKYRLQVFAIYIPDDYPKTIATMLKMIDLLYSKILVYPELYMIRTREDLQLCFREGKIGVMLSIEGVECLEANIFMSSIIKQLGVEAIGLTWNRQNWAAEGVLANTNTGISNLGKQFINRLALNNTILDVSHLSIRSFEDLLSLYSGPIWASHSNCYNVCDHPRNLNDEQIKALIERKSIIGMTYVPQFIRQQQQVYITDVLEHIDHIISLGGVNSIALGSDFDGIDQYVNQLNQPLDVQYLVQLIEKRYGYNVAEAIAWKNAYTFLQTHLI